MASIDEFEDHCWKDMVPEADTRIYAPYARDTAVGPNAALLCIDLYNQVYDGGPRPPIELAADDPSSCGIYAHRAVAPTKRLIAAVRGAGLPIFFCTQDIRANARPMGAVSTKRRARAMTAENYAIYKEFLLRDSDILILKQRASAFQGTPILSHLNVLGVRSLIVCGEQQSSLPVLDPGTHRLRKRTGSFLQDGVFHLETAAKRLITLGGYFRPFFQMRLEIIGSLSRFDSAIPRV
jgi:maleamate amidohydrolase